MLSPFTWWTASSKRTRTAPLRAPGGLIVAVAGPRSVNVAVTVRAWSIVTAHPFGSVPVQSPDHVRPDHASGVAVRVTVAPGANVAAHAPGQAIPAGAETTVPAPVPRTCTRSR